jgi:alpha-ketoglutarate-dependent taurine dioxygenase
MHGTYLENEKDLHVIRRKQLLHDAEPIRGGELERFQFEASCFQESLTDDVLNTMLKSGLAILQLDELLTNEQFMALGAKLGSPMAETSPSVMPYVEDRVILNLRTEHNYTDNVNLEPFSENPISLHTESSGRRLEEQPRYIVLMCCVPGGGIGAQTVNVSMHCVEQHLEKDTIEILSRTSYRTGGHAPPLLRVESGRRIFCFRDFQTVPLNWQYGGRNVDSDAVNRSIGRLLAAMYAPECAVGIKWARAMIVIIDNTYYFHGRTMASVASGPQRHLKRLRII